MPGLLQRLCRAALLLAVVASAASCKTKADDGATDEGAGAATRASLNARALATKKSAQATKPPAHFVAYNDTRIGFVVWAPRKPNVRITPMITPAGKTLAEEFDFGVGGASHALLVTVAQLPAEKGAPLDAEGALVNSLDGVRRKLSGRLLADGKWNPTDKDGKQLVGREYRIEGKVGELVVVVYVRALVRDAWLYQVMALHSLAGAAGSQDGEAFVRSFRLGDRPKERALLPSGLLPVTLGTPTIDVLQKFKEPKFYLRVKLSATVVQTLVALEHLFYRVWCKVGAVQKTYERASQALRAVAPKLTKELNVAPFLEQPLEAKPETCQVSVHVRRAATNVATLGSFCFAQQKVTKGACPN